MFAKLSCLGLWIEDIEVQVFCINFLTELKHVS